LNAAEQPDSAQERTRSSKGINAWEKYAQALLLANEFIFVD
jgi:hypothetical protein